MAQTSTNIYRIKDTGNTEHPVNDGVINVIGTQTAATAAWTGNIPVNALYTGLTINYYLPYDGVASTNVTLNLTLADGTTTTGAKNVYITTGRLTTHYGAGRNILMTYYAAGDISIKGTATTDDRWICDAYYDSNSNDLAYQIRNYYNYYKAGANKVFPYTFIMQCSDGRWESIVTSSSTGTSKARNTHGFRLGQLALMYANATYNENAKIADANVWFQQSSGLVDHRYSFNTANNATSGTTSQKPVYLVGSINSSDGLFYLDTTWWTQTLPSTADGKLYIYLGDAYDYYRMSFIVKNPIYRYIDGKIQEYSQSASYADNANSATSANSLNVGDIGNDSFPVYFDDGLPVASSQPIYNVRQVKQQADTQIPIMLSSFTYNQFDTENDNYGPICAQPEFRYNPATKSLRGVDKLNGCYMAASPSHKVFYKELANPSCASGTEVTITGIQNLDEGRAYLIMAYFSFGTSSVSKEYVGKISTTGSDGPTVRGVLAKGGGMWTFHIFTVPTGGDTPNLKVTQYSGSTTTMSKGYMYAILLY